MAWEQPVRTKHDRRYGGMGNDEYSGAFLYGENVDIRANTRYFTLEKELQVSGKYYYGDEALQTKAHHGGREYYVANNRIFAKGYRDQANHGPLYKVNDDVVHSFVASNRFVTISKSGNSRYTTIISLEGDLDDGMGMLGVELVTDANFASLSGWTVGAGWTQSGNGIQHDSGTDSIKQDITTDGGEVRVGIEIDGFSAGSLEVKLGGTSLGTISHIHDDVNGYAFIASPSNGTNELEIIPTADFDGRIIFVSARDIDNVVKMTLPQGANIKYLGVYDGDAYVAQDNVVTTIDLFIGDLVDELTLPKGTEIFGLTQIGTILNIYTNHIGGSTKYLRDGVSDFPEMRINRSGTITGVVGNGNLDFVSIGDSLYITQGYDRQKVWYGGNDHGITMKTLLKELCFSNVGIPVKIMDDILYTKSSLGTFTYGEKTPGMGKSRINSNINGKVVGDADYITDGGVKIRGYLGESEKRYESGYIITRPEVFQGLGESKIFNKVKFGAFIPSKDSKVNIYMKANDYRYFTFYHAGLTAQVSIGDIYKSGNNVFEVITVYDDRFETIATIVDQFIDGIYPISVTGGTIEKDTGDGDQTITYTDVSNFIYINTIQAEELKYTRKYIYDKDIINKRLEDIYKLSFKLELYTDETQVDNPSCNTMVFISSPDQDEFI